MDNEYPEENQFQIDKQVLDIKLVSSIKIISSIYGSIACIKPSKRDCCSRDCLSCGYAKAIMYKNYCQFINLSRKG